MVSKYDVFYIIATQGEIKISRIVDKLNKPKNEYQNIFNKVLELEKEGYVKREDNVKIVHNKKSEELFNLISFSTHNKINYNLLFKKSMLELIHKASKKEFFTIKDINIHQQTYKQHVELLSKYGFLIILSKKPLKCKLLRHHFFIDLLNLFNIGIKFYTPIKINLENEIKKELKTYKKNIKSSYTIQDELDKQREAKFIYSSLSLEGNPLTLPETQELILNDIVPKNSTLDSINEVTNYKKAIDLMIRNAKKRIKLTKDLILRYHLLGMNHIIIPGKFRNQNVIIKNNPDFKTSDYKEINSKITKLLDDYMIFENKKKDIIEIIMFASFFHNEFQRIHPFIDGNSRMSRLLLLHILRMYELPVLDLPIGYFDEYLDLTKRSSKRDDNSFYYLIQEIVLINLKMMNVKLS